MLIGQVYQGLTNLQALQNWRKQIKLQAELQIKLKKMINDLNESNDQGKIHLNRLHSLT